MISAASQYALLTVIAAGPNGEAQDYALKAKEITKGVYVFAGRREHFTEDNGGNIVNTGFIVGRTGVIVIDTGPSRLYGEAMVRGIRAVTKRPIVRIYITHGHPDHFLGNQAFKDVPIFALPKTRAHIRESGEDLAENLYRLLAGWMRGTVVVEPTDDADAGRVIVAGRRLRILAFDGHTDADLVVVDEATKTWFVGDLVFLDRAPTTPNAEVDAWQRALGKVAAARPRRLVPGHGPVHRGRRGVRQTQRYLRWLVKTLTVHADAGRDMAEAFADPSAPRFIRSMGAWPEEYRRSVVHLFPDIETAGLQDVSRRK